MQSNHQGFTIVELMVVVGIIAVLAGISVPVIVSQLPERNLNSAAREMVSNLRRARTLAIKLNRDVGFRFEVAKNSYTLVYPSDPPSIASDAFVQEFPLTGNGIRFGYTDPKTKSSRSDPVTFTDDRVTFNSTGLLKGREAADYYAFVQNSKNKGYRIGVRGMAANVVMELCGGKCSKSDGNVGTLDCTQDGAAACQ